MPAELVGEEAGESHLTACKADSEEIEAMHPQTGKLTKSATGVGGSENQGTVGSVNGVGDLGDLLGIRDAGPAQVGAGR